MHTERSRLRSASQTAVCMQLRLCKPAIRHITSYNCRTTAPRIFALRRCAHRVRRRTRTRTSATMILIIAKNRRQCVNPTIWDRLPYMGLCLSVTLRQSTRWSSSCCCPALDFLFQAAWPMMLDLDSQTMFFVCCAAACICSILT